MYMLYIASSPGFHAILLKSWGRGYYFMYVLATLVKTLFILSYVSPPRPMDVKKLMANRVFFGLSRGMRPSKADVRSLITF